MSLRKHIEEIAFESGIDLEEESAVSHEERHTLADLPPIETWYQESGVWEPWKAFLAGVGTRSGWSAEEAAQSVAEFARERIAAGLLIGPDYLASLRAGKEN